MSIRLVGWLLLLETGLTASLLAQPIKQLQPETVRAFETYLKVVDEDIRKHTTSGGPFLWLDTQPRSVQLEARRGEVVLHQFSEGVEIPAGLIHDWIGSTFIAGAKAEELVAFLRNYERHKEVYPEAVDSRTLESRGDVVRGYIQLQKKMVFSVLYNTEYTARFLKPGPDRWHIVVDATRVAEVRDGKELPVGRDSGFLWRLRTYWRLEQIDDGVMIECNVIALSRSIPWGLGWAVRPYSERAAREVVVSLLEGTRRVARAAER